MRQDSKPYPTLTYRKKWIKIGKGRKTPVSGENQFSGIPSVPRRPLQVLLAEDTPANQKLVRHMLGKRGHTLEIAENGRQALERLAARNFDVVLMDVHMPEMDGFQATIELRKLVDPEKAAVPVIAMTAHALKRDHDRCLTAGMKDTTIATHLRHLRASLNWAVSMEMLSAAPKFHMPKRVKGRKLMRGRPITTEEFERMLAAVPLVRSHDREDWQHYLHGLWLLGLRLEESLVLGWDDESPISIDLGGRHPRLRIYAEAEKGHQDRLLPITPDFAEFLLQTPKQERHGSVLKLLGRFTRKPMTPPALADSFHC